MSTKDPSTAQQQARLVRLRHVTPPSFERAPAPVTEGVIAFAKAITVGGVGLRL